MNYRCNALFRMMRVDLEHITTLPNIHCGDQVRETPTSRRWKGRCRNPTFRTPLSTGLLFVECARVGDERVRALLVTRLSLSFPRNSGCIREKDSKASPT